MQHLEQEGVVLPNLSGFGKKIPYMVTLLLANLRVFDVKDDVKDDAKDDARMASKWRDMTI